MAVYTGLLCVRACSVPCRKRLQIICRYISVDMYVYDVNILGGSVHTVRENAEALVVATKEIGLEVNDDKTK